MQIRYTLPARLLHWLTAIGIIAAFGLALSFDDMKLSPAKITLINYHKWIGITVLGLVAVRLLWRLTHPAPRLPASMPKWETTIAHATHTILYCLMFAVPLGGWLYSSAKGYPVVWLGLVRLPDLIGKNPALAELLKDLHGTGGWAMILLALLHAAAALKHHFISRDDILKRMI